MAMITAEELCKKFNDRYPYPSCMEILTDKQREAFLKMAELGLVKFSSSVRCGFEAIRGDYVHLTKAGFEAATLNTLPSVKPEPLTDKVNEL